MGTPVDIMENGDLTIKNCDSLGCEWDNTLG
jgi:hypothetical protein